MNRYAYISVCVVCVVKKTDKYVLSVFTNEPRAHDNLHGTKLASKHKIKRPICQNASLVAIFLKIL